MEVKIKNNNELIEADWTVEDGVMVVSPKEVFEPKDGDVITCTNDVCTYTLILKEVKSNRVYHHAVLLDDGFFETDDWISYVNPRPATEEEKKKLFDKLVENGWEWDADKKQIVKLKWKPKYKEFYFKIIFEHAVIIPFRTYWTDDICDKAYYQKGWVFKTKEECQAFCKRLNQALENIKP